MATSIKITIISILLVISISQSYSGEYSGLLSRLYKKASEKNRPLILVLDASSSGKPKGITNLKKTQSSVEEDEAVTNPLMFLYRLAQAQQKSSVQRPHKPRYSHTHTHSVHYSSKPKPHNHERDHRPRTNYRLDSKSYRERREEELLRSPVIKTLLRMAKEWRKDDFDCDEEEKEKEQEQEKNDECVSTEDECGDEDVAKSTKGEVLISEGTTDDCK